MLRLTTSDRSSATGCTRQTNAGTYLLFPFAKFAETITPDAGHFRGNIAVTATTGVTRTAAA